MNETYSVTMNDKAKTEIAVEPRVREIEKYGLVQAILLAAHRTPEYQLLREEEDAHAIGVTIEGDEITQF